MSDISERASVYQRRCFFQRLNEVRLESILQQSRHRSLCFQLTRCDRLLIISVSHDDAGNTFF